MRKLVPFVAWAFCLSVCAEAGAKADLAKLTASPDGKIAIRANDPIGGMDSDFDFHEVSSGKSLGHIEAADSVSKVVFVCRWSPGGSRVAVLMFYGTKCSTLLIFEKGRDGQMREIPLDVPDPADAYAKAKLKPGLGSDHSGGSLNGLGKWKGEDSVELISGAWLDRPDGKEVEPSGLNLVVSVDVKIVAGKAVIGGARPHQLMSDSSVEAFFKERGIVAETTACN
jgi:hypothetical protein